jgi:DNA-binding PadR family transcriptional regulator
MSNWTLAEAMCEDAATMAERTLNSTAASLLGFLHRGPMSGWDLAATAETVIGDFWSVTRSQVYRELAWMAEEGLVDAGEPGARDRRPYTLTDLGRDAFQVWIEGQPGPETIRFPLLLTMSFGSHLDPQRLAGFVRDHRAVHAARLARYEETAAVMDEEGADAFARSTLQFGLQYERAVLGWFDSLPKEIGRERPPQD